jgi:hypothetical protein
MAAPAADMTHFENRIFLVPLERRQLDGRQGSQAWRAGTGKYFALGQ